MKGNLYTVEHSEELVRLNSLPLLLANFAAKIATDLVSVSSEGIK